MPAGDAFTAQERHEIDRAIRDAETVCRYEFSVFVGAAEAETRPFATRLHASLAAPDRSVLVMVDPSARIVEIVTGAEVRRDLDDGEAHLAALTMQSAFAAGDLVGGITHGLSMLADHARRPRMLHAE
ncbi:MAG: hypothetical protein AVDCRST_MAG72-477 [uncultured Nocardioidaceae bacterium]|uniref:DUF5130 domain-containing protein n=1 Tax=uncultured Nocardioidaceae bacterium TaxID=253824 RepID=A0A6J4LK20_9ACTN|nr:MAG: hypothetical protein AVDCRST_MAG72-477 [uncultured Nocardioidaceae bacterium]